MDQRTYPQYPTNFVLRNWLVLDVLTDYYEPLDDLAYKGLGDISWIWM